MQRYIFKPKECPLITSWLANYILSNKKKKKLRVTLDLGLSYIEAEIRNNELISNEISLDLNLLKDVKGDVVYALIKGRLLPIKFYDEVFRKFYKLRAIGMDKAPTLEINGIHMHRIEGIDPWTDSLIKVKTLGSLRSALVLDTCTGLGYTAIISLKFGASKVVSVEIDPNVLRIAEFNSWSRGLVHVEVILGDITKVIKNFDDESFTHVIHDPPRYELAGELYSLEFYKELSRVLRRGGRLFHYVGKPGWRRGISIAKGVKNRLAMAGFNVVRWVEEAQGFIAIKI